MELGAKHLGRLVGLRSGLKRHFAAHQRGFHTRGHVTAIDERAGLWVVQIDQQLMCGERLVAQAISEIQLGKA